jgi:hypothetical protein
MWEMIYGSPPDVSFLRTIECTAYVHMRKPQRSNSNLDNRATKELLLGYATVTKDYRVLTSQNPVTIIDTMHVTFSEDINNPSQLLSLSDRDGEHFFGAYPYVDNPKFEEPSIPEAQVEVEE